ncbi:hypothetical protein [Microvirga massiliensis]|uniref:hypothetical protein n=1 Tax=Microvirga massiliensis TaxID=1033741 RepID=UPI00062B5321|nr:hypothetical protein [Microvirga massiliensis]
MTDYGKVEVHVPSLDEKRISLMERDHYFGMRDMAAQGISKFGLEVGGGIALSGVARELRRHLTLEQVQEVFRQFAETMPQAAAGDEP